MTDAIHIHEDDWAMRNLYPAHAADEVAAEVLAAYEAGERNRAPSGFGWTDVHMIPYDQAAVDRLCERRPDAGRHDDGAPLHPARAKRFNATITAYLGSEDGDVMGPYEDEAWCFGRSENCFIKLEPEGELVRDIWFELRGTDRADATAIRAAIEAVDRLAPSCLADYRLSFATPADREGLDEYFALHAAKEAELASMFKAAESDD